MLNTKTMNLNLIRTFVIVGQSKDLKEAASKLDIDPTNVSRNIKSLESIMGTKLINRNSKNYIELTENGKELFEGYEKAYNLLFITEKTYLQNKTLNTGKITIGVSTDDELNLLNDKIKEFKKKYPNVVFKTLNLPTKDLFEKLSQYYLDFVIDEPIENLRKSDEIKLVNIFNEDYCIAYNPTYFDFKLESVEQLKEQPMIVPSTSKKERSMFDELLEENNIKVNISLEISNYNIAKDYVESGLGFGLLPKRLVNNTNLESLDINIIKPITISYVEENLSPSAKQFLSEFK
ncbi:MAG: LysR family transcriptional regulator [Bacilli bacterium]|nr:LysR family transcriptional regulator [Bacilli bacterium]